MFRPANIQMSSSYKEALGILLDELCNDKPQTISLTLIEKIKEKRDEKPFAYEITNKEFIKLLQWSLSENRAALIAAVLQDEFSRDFQEELKKYLVSVIQKNDTNSTKMLLLHSNYLKNNCRDFRGGASSYKHGICGSTLLQLAAVNGNIELCKFMVELFPGWHLDIDFYQNNCLHYAASGSNPTCYEFFKQIHPSWENEKNIFSHRPSDYLPDKIKSLIRIDQNHLLKQFTRIIESFNREIDVETLRHGLCYGISLFMAICLLRGSEDWKFYQSMIQKISKWQQTDSFDEIKEAFEVLLQNYRYFFNFQSMLDSNLDLSKGDRSNQFAFINLGKDSIYSQTDYGIGNLNKKELREILENNMNQRNIILSICATPNPETSLLNHMGHAVSIVINEEGAIFFCDPSSPYFTRPMSAQDIDVILNIIYKYFDNVHSVETYSYHNKEFKKNPMLEKQSNETNELLNNFFSDRKGHDVATMMRACESDTPQTLNFILNKISVPIDEDYFKILINTSIKNNSFRCLEVLEKYYTKLTNKSIEEMMISFDIPEEASIRYQNFKHNKF